MRILRIKPLQKTSSKPVLLLVLMLVLLLVAVQLTSNLQFAPPQAEMPKASSLNISTSSSDTNTRIALHQSSLQILEHRDGADTICSLLKANSQQLSLNSIWMRELDKIRDSLLHSPANKPFGKRSGELQKLIDQVLDALPPSRLRRSLRPQSVSPEHHPQKIRRILNILWKRYQTTKEDTTNTAMTTTPSPKLQVLVFGGSPTAGSNCERNKRLKKQGNCAWPGHLETFLNAFLGFDAVQVVNYAMGATSSSVASMILRFRLFPPSMMPDGPDIIINAYAVNDYSYYDSGVFPKMVQDFTESANTLSSCQGDRPLVVYLDDFVVNFAKGRALLTSETYNADIGKLMQWYQVMTVAYSDVVRDMVYANREEQVLLVDWKHDDKHLTWAGHIAIVLSFMFNGVNSVLDFCDDETYRILQHGSKKSDINSSTTNSKNATKALILDPSLRLVLDERVALSSITENWKGRQNGYMCQSGGGHDQRCAFAWVAMRREAEMGHLPQGQGPKFQEVDGWQYCTTWPPTDYGLYATASNGTFLLNVTDDTSTSSSGH
jgi:hypothetical protein